MSLPDLDAYTRLRDAAQQIDAALVVDRPSIHWIDGPYPGVSYGLALGAAHALLFMPAEDITEPGWERRLAERLVTSRQYLLGFTHTTR